MGSMPNLDDNEYDFHGHIAMAHLTDEVLYTTDFTPSLSPSASNSTFLFDFTQGEHQNQIDETANFTYSITVMLYGPTPVRKKTSTVMVSPLGKIVMMEIPTFWKAVALMI